VSVLVVLLIIAALVGGVIWNKRNAGAAMSGVQFSVPATADVVTGALRNAYCRSGAKSLARSMVSGITVAETGGYAFRIDTKLGDNAEIVVSDNGGGASLVTARTNELYVGSHPSSHFSSGLMAIGAVMTHNIFKLLGITPSAARLKRFQCGVESRVLKELQRAPRA